MGLLTDLKNAKIEAERVRMKRLGVTDKEIREGGGIKLGEDVKLECKLTRDAIVDFLTHDKLFWTITELKASVELEELKTTDGIKSSLKPDTLVADKKPILDGIKAIASAAGLGSLVDFVEDALTKVVEPISKDAASTDPIEWKKGGSKMGGAMVGTGHAWIGEDDPTPNSDTTTEKNNFTKVKLIKNKIRKDLLI